MYNVEALACSRENLPGQIEFTLKTLPFIRQITPVDSTINMKKDYLFECDAVGLGSNHKNYNLQYKVRPNHTDFVLVGTKVTGDNVMRNPNLGFYYNGVKYTFCPIFDYLIERINGVDYLISCEEILTMELLWPNDLSRAITRMDPKIVTSDDGTKISTDAYYFYIPLETMTDILFYLRQYSNPNLDFASALQES